MVKNSPEKVSKGVKSIESFFILTKNEEVNVSDENENNILEILEKVNKFLKSHIHYKKNLIPLI
jgi:hypothetical protein